MKPITAHLTVFVKDIRVSLFKVNTKQLYKRLEPIVNAMDKSIICQSITDNGDGTYTFTCSNTKWITTGFNVIIGLNSYLIVEFECNEWIKVSGSVLPTQLTFDIYPFKFKHGTIKAVASELNQLHNYTDRLPLLFLHDITEDKIHFDKVDAVDNNVDVKLYFLIDCDYANWNINDSDLKAVNPMRNAVNEFIKSLSVSQYVAQLTSIGTVRNYNRFGNFDDNGVLKNIFNEYLSGVQLRVSIPFLKECECCDDTLLDNRPAPAYVYDTLGNVLAILYSNEYYISSGGSCDPVLIKDKDTGVTIAKIASGGEYEVTQLTSIKDTITSNITTIIDPLN